MSTTLAMRTGLPGELRQDSYTLPPDLTYAEWKDVLALTEYIAEASPWWLGDALVYGERRFPDRHSQALPTAEEDPSGARQSRIKSAVWVSSKFPPVTRVTELSWSHHRAVAEFDPPEAKALLEAAKREKLATRELIERANKRKEQKRGHAIAADGAALSTELLTWQPAISDLTDEARAALEANAPGGRHRLGYEQGFLRGLVFADARTAFKEWRE
jgi:hypothetical protein